MGQICNKSIEGKVKWQAPLKHELGSLSQTRTPIATRSFEFGEFVEKAYCLRLKRSDFVGSSLEPYLYPVPGDTTGAKLFALGFGLLYSHSQSHSNLTVEHVLEVPQPEQETDQLVDDESEPCDFLVFSAAQAIAAGDELLVAPPNPSLPTSDGISVVDVMAHSLGMHEIDIGEELQLHKASDEGEYRDDVSEGSGVVDLFEEEDDTGVLAPSHLGGRGMFASRDIQKGEVISQAPNLPLSNQEQESTLLNDYVFDSCFPSYPDIVFMQINVGCVYNHSEHPNIERIFDTPLVTTWIAKEFIPEGRELCQNYGPDFFESRGMELKKPVHEQM